MATRGNAGRMRLRRVPLDLREVVRDVVEGRRPQAAGRGVDLTLEVPRALPLVLADPDRLAEVMDCLLGNALVRVSDGGRVAVRVEDRGREVAVAVADDGPGAEPSRLFDRLGPGGGLGLATARRVVEAHGGCIWSEPTPAGGLMVTLTLPAAEVG